MQSARIVVVGDNLDSLKVKLLTSYVEKSLASDEATPSTFFNFSTYVTYKSRSVNLQLVDTSGQEDFDMIRQLSYAGANVLLLVFSVHHPISLKNIKTQWVQEVRQYASGVPYLLVGCYLQSRESSASGFNITAEKAMKVARKIGAVGYYECSPDLNIGVDAVFKVAIGIGLNDPEEVKVKDIDHVINEVKEKKLDTLVYALSNLKVFSTAITDCIFLKKIILNDNDLTSIPYVGGLLFLEELNVDHNRISSIHRSLFVLPNLAVFSAKNNNISASQIPKDLGKMNALHTLALSQNSLNELPLGISTIPYLVHLELTNCNISVLPPHIGKLVDLETFIFNFNFIKHLPTEMEFLYKLKVLALDNNSLEGQLFPQIGKLTSLRQLTLTKNQLTSISSFIGTLQNLETLQLNDNNLYSLPAEIGHLLSLKVLEVDNNKLVTLPCQIGFLPLEVFMFLPNPLDVPQNIQEGGMRAMMPYLRDLSRGTDRLYKMKLMFVGMEGVGKTTLFKKLRGYDTKVQENISTNGVEIGEWSVTVTNAKAKLSKNRKLANYSSGSKDVSVPRIEDQITVKFSAWDFGGQEIFYSTHQFFISQRSVYMIIFSLINIDELRIEYWLKAIRAGAKKAPILLIGSHLDHPKCKRELAGQVLEDLSHKFQRNFPNIRGYFAISSITGEGIEELRSAIEEVSLAQPSMGEVIPGSYKVFEGVLAATRARNAQCPVISQKELKQMAIKSGLDDDLAARRAIKFFHELGSLLHFDKGENKLREIVILDPQWLTNLLSTIITFKHRFVKDGLLNLVDIIHLWRYPEYPIELHEKLLSILTILEVAWPTPDNKLLIPSLLPDLPPAGLPPGVFPDTVYKSVNTRLYKFDFMPFGFFSRIMVRVLHSMACVQYWKNGMIVFPKKAKGDCGAIGMVTTREEEGHYILEISVTIPADAHILLAETEIAQLLRNIDDPAHGFSDLEHIFMLHEVFDILLRMMSKRSLAKHANSLNDLRQAFSFLITIGGKYKEALSSPNPMYDMRDISSSLSAAIKATIACMRKVIQDCGVAGPVGLNAYLADIDSTHMQRIIFENVDSLVKWYNTQYDVLIPCIDCVDEKNPSTHHFKLQEVEEAFIKKEVVIDGSKDIGIVCPAGHSKIMFYNEGLQGFVVELTRLAPDITMNDLYRFLIPFHKVEIFTELGRGSFGKVLKGKWHNKDVAVKQMLTYEINNMDMSPDQKEEIIKSYQEFRHEAWLMSTLTHPNVVKMYGVSVHPLCMITEFVPNGDLFRYLIKGDPGTGDIPWKFKLKVALDIAKGMEYLHSTTPPLIHRDLKSPNVLMASLDHDADINCKVADFGLTRMLTTSMKSCEFYNPRWLAPEVMRGEDYTEKVDVYSFAVILWEIYTRQKPYAGVQFDRQIEEMVCNGERLPLPDSCPSEYAEIIVACWQQDPSQRPSFSQVVKSLTYLLEMANSTIHRRAASEDSLIWNSGSVRMSIAEKKKNRSASRLTMSGSVFARSHSSTINLKTPPPPPPTGKATDLGPKEVSFPRLTQTPADLGLIFICTIKLDDRPQSVITVHKHKQVWIGRHDGIISVYGFKKYKEMHYWAAHTERVNGMAVVNDYVWSCSDDGSVCIWDPKNFGAIDKIQLPCQILSIAVAPGTVLCGCSDGTICRWDASLNNKIFSLGSFTVTGPVCAMLTDDRGKIWIGTEQEIHVLSAMTFKIIKSWKAHNKAIKSLVQVGEHVWSASDDSKIGVWNVTSLAPVKMLSYHSGRVLCLLNTGNHVFSGSFDASFAIWDAEKATCLGGVERHKDTIRAMALIGGEVWVASLDRTVTVWKYLHSTQGRLVKAFSSFLVPKKT